MDLLKSVSKEYLVIMVSHNTSIVNEYSDEIIHLYYCDQFEKAERHLDNDEFIDLLFLSLDEIENLIKKGQIKDSKILSAITLYKSLIL